MTLSEMQLAVFRHLGQPSTGGYVSTTEVQSAINDACRVVAKEQRVNMTMHTRSTVSGTGNYTLPLDTIQLLYIELDISGTNRRVPIEIVGFEEFAMESYDNTALTGEPCIAKVEWGATATSGNSVYPGDIWLYPIPNSSSHTLRLYTIQRPTDLSSANEISELPVHLHQAVTYMAAIMLSLKDSDYKRIQVLEALYAKETMDGRNVRNQRTHRRRPGLVRRHGRRYLGY